MLGESLGSLIRWMFVAAFAKPIVKWMRDEISFGGMVKSLVVVSFWWVLTLASLFGVFMACLYALTREGGANRGITDTVSSSSSMRNVDLHSVAVDIQPQSLPASSATRSSVVDSTSGTDEYSRPLMEAGFDCRYAVTKAEELICASYELSDLDGQLNALFREKRTPELALSQRAWIKERGNHAQDAEEMKSYYLERIEVLSAM